MIMLVLISNKLFCKNERTSTKEEIDSSKLLDTSSDIISKNLKENTLHHIFHI